jgi:thiol-disulfide isomerase/thioredoxin
MHRIVLAVALVSTVAFAQEELAEVGKAAPMFGRLPLYNAKAVGETAVGLDRYVGPDAADKKTKVVLISFMASFCGPCKKELPYLQSLHQKYSEQGLRVVSIAIDREPEGQKKVEDLVAEAKITFPVLKDRFNILARRWLGSQSPLPSVFLLKPDGTVTLAHRGYNEDASKLLTTEVEAALKK